MKNEATGLTERETARRAYDIARGFVRNFDSSFENLFLYGDTGVGKTFLSHCIAHDLLESAHCVMYFSAFDLFELLADSKFSRDKTEGSEAVPADKRQTQGYSLFRTESGNSAVPGAMWFHP